MFNFNLFDLDIAVNTQWSMFFIIIALTVASFIYLVLKQYYPTRDYHSLWLRIRSWWWMIAIVFTALISSFTLAICFFTLLSYLAFKEFISIIPTRQVDRRAIFWVYLAIPLQFYWVYSHWYGLFIIFIPIYVYFIINIRLLLIGQTQGFIRASATLHWGAMLTIYSLSHIAYLLALPAEINPAGGALGLVIFLLLLTQFNDVAQYVWGKCCGRHKIIPLISPNKTWEGFIGGLMTITILGGLLAPILTPLQGMAAYAVSASIAVAGFFGDLTLSAVKRDIGIKDTGQFIPGHGGILDRLDSLTMSAPLFFHALYYLHY